MLKGVLKVELSVATVMAWAAFLFLDSLWSACLSRAVEEGSKAYGEIYGPLSFFRPLSMYSAWALSLLCAGLLVIGSKEKKQ